MCLCCLQYSPFITWFSLFWAALWLSPWPHSILLTLALSSSRARQSPYLHHMVVLSLRFQPLLTKREFTFYERVPLQVPGTKHGLLREKADAQAQKCAVASFVFIITIFWATKFLSKNTFFGHFLFLSMNSVIQRILNWKLERWLIIFLGTAQFLWKNAKI